MDPSAVTTLTVIGAGSWGTTVACLASGNVPTRLWARRAEAAEEISRTRRNSRYLPGVTLPAEVVVTASLESALSAATAVAVAVPAQSFRRILTMAAPFVPPGVPVISLTKGLERSTLDRMTEIVAEVLPGHPRGVLTGPNLAREIVAGRPAASVVALDDAGYADGLQAVFSTGSFRVYTNPDLVGCEIAGAVKNVIAIAAGICDGLDLGDNAKAALITRGLAELSRLGVALGGDPRTFAGLAGLGDLVATCTSAGSRNHFVGQRLGEGLRITEITAAMGMVAEGVETAQAAVRLAETHGVELPIAQQVGAVIAGETTPRDAIGVLMGRQPRAEWHGLVR